MKSIPPFRHSMGWKYPFILDVDQIETAAGKWWSIKSLHPGLKGTLRWVMYPTRQKLILHLKYWIEKSFLQMMLYSFFSLHWKLFYGKRFWMGLNYMDENWGSESLEKQSSISRSSPEIIPNFSHVVLTLTFVVLGNLQFRSKKVAGL